MSCWASCRGRDVSPEKAAGSNRPERVRPIVQSFDVPEEQWPPSAFGKIMSSLLPNRQRYLVSLAEELYAQANRVRDLIGDAHWLSDGHHKEYLLIDLL